MIDSAVSNRGIGPAVARNRLIAYAIVALSLIACFGVLQASGWQGNRQIHTMMEVVATLLAAFVGVVAMVRFYTKKNNAYLFIGVGFFGTALLDGYHAVVTCDLLDYIMVSPPPSLIPWSWNASRTFLAILMFISWLAWRREQRKGQEGRINENVVYALVGALTIISFCFFAFMPLPRAYYPEFFFGRPEEFIAATFFALALCGYLAKEQWKTDSFEFWLVMSLMVGFLTQALVMSRSFTLFDVNFDLAHSLKIVSYALVLTGLLINMYQLFQQAERSIAEIACHADELREEVERRQRSEQSLRLSQARLTERAEQLAASNGELEQFAYVASHDLQEPLRKVSAFCQMLKEKYGPSLDEDANTYIDYSVDGAARMKCLIADLLGFSRISSRGEGAARTDSAASFRNAISNLELMIEESEAVVTCDELPTVMSDKVQLSQLFQNLVGNGIKYRDASRRPTIHVGAMSDGERWVFSVQDNGIGIGSDYYAKIFEIFKRLHARSEYSGTGIGLAICKKIVDRMGGKIWVESEEGVGSTFYFTVARTNDSDNENLAFDETDEELVLTEV